jgi:DNA-directed RNA polymerase subunit RPC12/RpoP
MPSFHCIHCGQRIEAPEVMMGSIAACPTCGGEIQVPSAHKSPLMQRKSPKSAATASSTKIASFVGSAVFFIVAVILGRSCGSILGKHSAETQMEKWKTSESEKKHVQSGNHLESQHAFQNTYVTINVGGIVLEVPKELSSLTVQRESVGEMKLLEKHTAVWSTRSILIKHFEFLPPRKVMPSEAADLTEEDIKSQQGYRASRKVVEVAATQGVILDAEYQGMGQKVAQSIIYFSRNHELWEIHLFGVNDNNPSELKEMKSKVFASIRFGS